MGLWVHRLLLSVVLIGGGACGAQEASHLVVPWSHSGFSADEGCTWTASAPELSLVRTNGCYLAPPEPTDSYDSWLGRLRDYRRWVRRHAWDVAGQHILLRFDGVRAWVRTGRPWAQAADLWPGEQIRITGEARAAEGNGTLCLAFDWCRRQTDGDGPWQGWSSAVATAAVPPTGRWQPFEITATVPKFAHDACWARPILGMDGTHDPEKGCVDLRGLRLAVPSSPQRAEAWGRLEQAIARRPELDDSLYDRQDLAWTRRNFISGFVFMYDRSFYEPQSARYTVARLCREAREQFGGYDSVLLWHAYPRIGVDDRNQFDFLRQMPGGLPGLREVVSRFHAEGVRVLVPYMPWDRGTRPEPGTHQDAIVGIVAAIGADGIFLDTMTQSPAGLRAVADASKDGICLEPEGQPPVQELECCSNSWAQGFPAYPGIGVLALKWIEPRHMQHQISRWAASHADELAAAWLNGSGVLVWEDVFGTWNPWRAEDRATLRRMAPVLRHYGDTLADAEWLPCCPTADDAVFASCWVLGSGRLWTLVNSGRAGRRTTVLEVPGEGQRFFDLWRGEELQPQRVGGRCRVALTLENLGAVAALPPRGVTRDFLRLLRTQREQAGEAPVKGPADRHALAQPVVEPLPAPAPQRAPVQDEGMLPVPSGTHEFVVSHQRRECGCYPDPQTPREEWEGFLRGHPFSETLTHRVRASVDGFRIDPRPVTNAQFAVFLQHSGYLPACPDRFLEHRPGGRCPDTQADAPVVCVDLQDARAYAAWRGGKLPDEWQWQAAAQQLGDSFERGVVWEWTESLRDDGHTRFCMLRGGSRYQPTGSGWYFPGGTQPADTHAKFILMYPGLDRSTAIGFRCVSAD